MLRQFTLQPNEDKRLQVEGRFLVITQATGPIELTIGGTTPVTVDEKDRIHMRGDSPNNRAIRIRNVSGGVNDIELHTSDLLVDKRAGVDVKNSIAIADDQRIGIDPGANIVQAIVQNPIRFDVDENAVKIEDGQCVGIDPDKNTVKAIIQNLIGFKPDQNQVKATITHDLILKPGQKIGIDPNANQVNALVTIKANQLVGINPDKNTVKVTRQEKEVNNLPTLDFEVVAPETMAELFITANNLRDSVILTADVNNAEPVWLGGTKGEGTPIFPGDRMFIEGTNKLFFVAPDSHALYASEVVYKG